MIYLGDLQKAIGKMTAMPDTWKTSWSLAPDVSKLLRTTPFVDFGSAYTNFREITGVNESISKLVAGSLQPSMSDVLANITSGFVFDSLPKIDLRSLYLPPNFDELLDALQERIERGEDGRQVLKDIGEPWLTALFDATEFADLANSTTEEQRIAIDETAQSLLVDEEFVVEVQSYVESLPLTQPRWRIIERAFDAHRNDDFLYSIPLLLSQLEGMYADLLIVKNLAIRQDGKLWELNPDTGQIRNNRNGDPLSVKGLSRIVEISGFRKSDFHRDFAGYVFTHTCPFRNGALHGSTLDFDTLQNSYRSALLLSIIAREFSDISEDLEDE